MTDQEILKSIKALARHECANFRDGACLLTDRRCHLISPNYETVHDGAIDCDYFLECVLPADWDLNDLIAYALWYDDENEEDELPGHMKRCEQCQTPFVVTGNRQKYCGACAQERRRQQGAKRVQKFRRM